jgi:hypothetical protein
LEFKSTSASPDGAVLKSLAPLKSLQTLEVLKAISLVKTVVLAALSYSKNIV